MQTTLKTAALATAIFLQTTGTVLAGQIKHGTLTISAPWAKATPAGARVAGGYLKIRNDGAAPDRLVGGTFARANRVEIHEMSVVNDIMRMRELPNGLTIKPGTEVVLKPGAFHLMFMGLKGQLKPGETVNGTLEFAKAGRIDVTYEVRTMTGESVGHGTVHHGDGHHGKAHK
jgi:periplasmic copper chaperone A